MRVPRRTSIRMQRTSMQRTLMQRTSMPTRTCVQPCEFPRTQDSRCMQRTLMPKKTSVQPCEFPRTQDSRMHAAHFDADKNVRASNLDLTGPDSGEDNVSFDDCRSPLSAPATIAPDSRLAAFDQERVLAADQHTARLQRLDRWGLQQLQSHWIYISNRLNGRQKVLPRDMLQTPNNVSPTLYACYTRNH